MWHFLQPCKNRRLCTWHPRIEATKGKYKRKCRETLPTWLEKREKRKERSALRQPLVMPKIYCQTRCTISQNMLQKSKKRNQCSKKALAFTIGSISPTCEDLHQ